MPSAFSWRNRVRDDLDGMLDLGVVTGSFPTLSFDSAYPATDALTPDPSRLSRVMFVNSAGAGTFGVTANWGVNLATRAVGALNVRIPAGVTGAQFQLLDAAGASIALGPVIPSASLVPIPGTEDRFDLHGLFPSAHNAARLRLRFNVSASVSGFVEIGHLWAGAALVFADGFNAGWRLRAIDDSPVSREAGGALVAQPLPTRLELCVDLSERTYQQLLGTPGEPAAPALLQMFREVGRSRPILALHRTDDLHASQIASIYGSIVGELPDIEHQAGPLFRSTNLTVQQIR